MKNFGLAFTFCAVMALMVLQIAPSHAIEPATDTVATATHASDTVLLTQEQFDQLAETRPALHAKLLRAQQSNSLPALTEEETILLVEFNAQNMDEIAGGGLSIVGYVLVAFVIGCGIYMLAKSQTKDGAAFCLAFIPK